MTPHVKYHRTDHDFNGRPDYYRGVYIDASCDNDDCQREHVHVFTDDQLRARDERLIRAAIEYADRHPYSAHHGTDFDAIIAAADQPEVTR